MRTAIVALGLSLVLVAAALPAAGAGDDEGQRRAVLPRGRELGRNAGLEEGGEGVPAGWNLYEPPAGMRARHGRFGISGSKGIRFFSPPPGASERIEPAGVNQVLERFEPGEPIEVTAWVRLTGFRGTCVVWARCDGKAGPESREGAFQNSILAGYDLAGTTIWSPVTVRVTPGEGTAAVFFGVLAGGAGTVEVDEVHALVREAGAPERPPPAGPGIFLAEGRYRALVSRPRASLKVLLPLPLLWREQVPLTFKVSTEPEGHIASARLLRREHGFDVAEVLLTAAEAGREFRFSFEALVLVRPHAPSPIPGGIKVPPEKVPAEVARWLEPTWCCAAGDPEIRKVAVEIRKGRPTADLVVPALLGRMREIFDRAEGAATTLTATEALTKQGSCTSCANLGAALLRACGIPARILAGYPTWSPPLQTHYAVEYWLPGCGWRLMETTLCKDDRPGFEQIEVAMVLPEDESAEWAGPRPGAAGGVPYLTLTEYPEAEREPGIFLAGAFPGAAGCDHRATLVSAIEAPTEQWEKAARVLAERWAKLSEDAARSPRGLALLSGPEGLSSARSLDDLLKALGR